MVKTLELYDLDPETFVISLDKEALNRLFPRTRSNLEYGAIFKVSAKTVGNIRGGKVAIKLSIFLEALRYYAEESKINLNKAKEEFQRHVTVLYSTGRGGKRDSLIVGVKPTFPVQLDKTAIEVLIRFFLAFRSRKSEQYCLFVDETSGSAFIKKIEEVFGKHTRKAKLHRYNNKFEYRIPSTLIFLSLSWAAKYEKKTMQEIIPLLRSTDFFPSMLKLFEGFEKQAADAEASAKIKGMERIVPPENIIIDEEVRKKMYCRGCGSLVSVVGAKIRGTKVVCPKCGARWGTVKY